jgi:hypothetical protein
MKGIYGNANSIFSDYSIDRFLFHSKCTTQIIPNPILFLSLPIPSVLNAYQHTSVNCTRYQTLTSYLPGACELAIDTPILK